MGFWRSQSKIDTVILDILARVEKEEPEWWGIGVEGYGPPGSNDGTVLEWALNNSGPWAIMLKFVQETNDGLLRTELGSNPHYCWVKVTLEQQGSQLSLFDDKYKDSQFALPGGNLTPAVVQHFRAWVRQKIMPALELAKVQSDTLSRQEHDRLAAMRKKYLS